MVFIVVNSVNALFIVCNVGVFNAFITGMTFDVVNGANTYDALFIDAFIDVFVFVESLSIVDSDLKSQQWAQESRRAQTCLKSRRRVQAISVPVRVVETMLFENDEVELYGASASEGRFEKGLGAAMRVGKPVSGPESLQHGNVWCWGGLIRFSSLVEPGSNYPRDTYLHTHHHTQSKETRKRRPRQPANVVVTVIADDVHVRGGFVPLADRCHCPEFANLRDGARRPCTLDSVATCPSQTGVNARCCVFEREMRVKVARHEKGVPPICARELVDASCSKEFGIEVQIVGIYVDGNTVGFVVLPTARSSAQKCFVVHTCTA